MMTMLTPAQQARQAVREACQYAALQGGCWLSFETASELGRLWRIGVGVDPETLSAASARLVRMLPRGMEPIVLCYRRPGHPPYLRISHDALARIRTHRQVDLGETIAAAIRTCAAMIHSPRGAGDRIPSCVLAVWTGPHETCRFWEADLQHSLIARLPCKT